MYCATIRARLSAMDQDNVKLLGDSWRKERPQDYFFYRPYTEGSEVELSTACTNEDESGDGTEWCGDEIITKAKKQEGRLLFINQTAWQSRLLMRYGQDVAFLDATYKTTKYSLPLFFIAVKTNVDYIIVASFVVQDETTESIMEALSILKQWNPGWRPQNFMTDLCEEEINALESIFPGIVYNNHKMQSGAVCQLQDWCSVCHKIACNLQHNMFSMHVTHIGKSDLKQHL